MREQEFFIKRSPGIYERGVRTYYGDGKETTEYFGEMFTWEQVKQRIGYEERKSK